MQSIVNIKTLDGLIRQYYKKNTTTNNYLLLDAYAAYVNEEKLFFTKTDSNLYLLVDKTGFYRLYYYINSYHEPFNINIEKPVVMEIIYRGKDNRPDRIISFWEKYGFKQHLTRDNMMAFYQQIIMQTTKTSGLRIKYAETEAEIAFTKDLIEQTLDKYTGDILTFDEIRNFAKKKNIICAYLQDKLCGILQFEIKNKVVWLGHIAVMSEYRGLGIAKALVKEYIGINAESPNTRYQLWVIQDNNGAVSLYEKFGFLYGHKTSASMLKT